VKNILFLFLLLPAFSIAQDCKLQKTVDPYTHATKVKSNFITINKGTNQALLAIDADNKEINILLSLANSGEKCFGEGSTAVILFDSSKVKGNYRNSSPMNCDGTFTIVFRNTALTQYALQRFARERIVSIRLTGNNKQVTDIVLDDDEKELLLQTASCFITEAKTLIK
jgi:hypothetical protein